MALSRTRSRGERDVVAPARSDAYTGLLAISLIALITGCVFLYLDYQQYPPKPPVLPAASAVKPPAAAAPGR